MSARSFNLFHPKKYGNIRVTEWQTVELHDNEIVRYTNDDIMIYDCGWRTVTTKTAINNALRQLNSPYSVYQKKGIWYIFNRRTQDSIYFEEEGNVLPRKTPFKIPMRIFE